MNNMKRLIAVMMVLTLALCFVACTQPQETPSTTTTVAPEKPDPTPAASSSSTKADEPDPEPTYIVTVVDQDGNPVAGVAVQLCDDGMCYPYVFTDENGVANFFQNIPSGAMTKVLLAEGYDFSTEYTLFAEGENTVTLTITKKAA